MYTWKISYVLGVRQGLFIIALKIVFNWLVLLTMKVSLNTASSKLHTTFDCHLLIYFILHLHIHWKLSQNGTVLRIAPFWPHTCTIYTTIIEMFGNTSCDIDSSWRSIYGLFFCWQKKCTGRHKSTTVCSYTFVMLLSHVFETVTICPVPDMAQLQHRFGLMLFTLAGEKVTSHAGSAPACLY